MKKILFMITKAPYGTSSAGEGFRAATALAGMDLDVTILLIEDGVFAALKGQKAETIGMKQLLEAIESAKEYGAKVLVHSESLKRRGIGQSEIADVQIIDTQGLADLLQNFESTLRF